MSSTDGILTVPLNAAGMRLDAFLAANLIAVSRGRIKRAVDSRAVTVNGIPRKASYRLRPGEIIKATIPPPEPNDRLIPETLPLDIIYEDDAILVVNKPRGMVSHPACGFPTGTLVNALLGYSSSLSTVGEAFRPGIIHRLDKDTSGLLLVAKTDEAHLCLAKQMEKRHIHRRYLALLRGETRWDRLRVDAPIGRSETDRRRMMVAPAGAAREAITDFEVVERFSAFTLVEAQLHTGRTHQVRVHAAYSHHPVAGDVVYGGIFPVPREAFSKADRAALDEAVVSLNGQALHAYRLEFAHPLTGTVVSLEAPAPQPLAYLLALLRSLS